MDDLAASHGLLAMKQVLRAPQLPVSHLLRSCLKPVAPPAFHRPLLLTEIRVLASPCSQRMTCCNSRQARALTCPPPCQQYICMLGPLRTHQPTSIRGLHQAQSLLLQARGPSRCSCHLACSWWPAVLSLWSLAVQTSRICLTTAPCGACRPSDPHAALRGLVHARTSLQLLDRASETCAWPSC